MNIIKGILIFTAGVAIGVGGSYIYLKKKIKEKDNEVQEVRDYYNEKYLDEKKRADKIIDDSKKLDKVIEDYTKKQEEDKVKYNKIGKEKEENEEVKAEAESPEEDEPTKPYLITEDEFLNDKNEYEKISLTYYALDDTLADEFDEMIDIEEAISTDIFNQIAESKDDLYVRNNSLETDFEIMKVEGSFHDKYGGF